MIPNFAPAFFHKGIALANVGMFEEALLAFDITLEITPGDPQALYQKGIALAHLDEHEKAVVAFKEASTDRSRKGRYSIPLWCIPCNAGAS